MRILSHILGKSVERPAEAPAADAIEAEMRRARRAFDGRDYATALVIWRELAERGVPRAQSNLAGLYSQGWGVPRDDAAAVAWFRRAAEVGDAIAQQNLGLMYYEGRGTDGDLAEAARWYAKAAEAGLAEAQDMLSWMLLEAVGVARDETAARRWAEAAAAQGNACSARSITTPGASRAIPPRRRAGSSSRRGRAIPRRR
jgi:TPR repeat protein